MKSKREEAEWQAPTPKEPLGDQYFYHTFINKTRKFFYKRFIIKLIKHDEVE